MIAYLLLISLAALASADTTESSDIRESSAQAVAPTPIHHIVTSPHPFLRQIVAPSRVFRRSITPVPITRAHRY
ncbi:unnamed protein product [Caenorhabditis bovis]|uniref:Uncharacterized protein n=1 Tax=Caenorhabditis bovis TaxID=2654633 RepID=A0A8S1F6J9_9PELO|nr:unnamed protein product [Caenorhabditis bovis]